MALEGCIDLYHLHKSFGDQQVLKDVSLKVSSGDFVVIAGMTGSGKSTLLRLIWGDERPSKGNVCVEGLEVPELSPPRIQAMRRKMGIVLQKPVLLEDRTVFANLEFVVKAFHYPRIKGCKRALQVLRLVGLEGKFRSVVRELSGGERQRLAVARALINGPDIILADEPTAHLDAGVASEIMEIFSLISRRGLTIVTVTHDLSTVENLDARCYELSEGRLVPIELGQD